MGAFDPIIPRKVYKTWQQLTLLKFLFPRGKAWDFTLPEVVETGTVTVNGGSTLGVLMSCFATELSRFEDDCIKLMSESVPGLAVELLEDWERVAGLPDDCSPLAGSVAQRQQIVHAKITQGKGNPSPEFIASNVEYFLNYATSLGMVITISEDSYGEPFRTTHKRSSTIQRVTRMPMPESVLGSRLTGIRALNQWTVTVVSDPSGNRDTMECVFLKMKPAQTHVIFLP